MNDLKDRSPTIEEFRQSVHEVGFEGDPEKLKDFYSQNVVNYEEYSHAVGREQGVYNVVKVFTGEVPDKNIRILDVASGTGQVGVQLKRLGHTEIDALDFSQEMLDTAKTKGIYKNYICDSILPDRKTKVDDETYDALLIIGCMAPGHLTPDSLPELTRMTKSGGAIVFTIFDDDMKHFDEFCKDVVEAKMQSLVTSGVWLKWTKQIVPFFASGETCNVYIGFVA